MKNFLITTIAFLAFAITCNAQWTLPGVNISNTNTGNVGIGTASPASDLHVYESNANNNATSGITIEQGGTGNALLQFLQTGTQRWTMGIDNANSRAFKIATGMGLGTADKFTILTSGFAGIGTTTPATRLQVSSSDATAGANVLTIENTGAQGYEAGVLFRGGYTAGSTPSGRITSLFDGGTSYANARTTMQSMLAGGIYDNTLTARNGNIGIGNTNPATKLQVTNSDVTAGANTLIIENSGTLGNEAAVLLKGGYATGSLSSGRIVSLFDGGTSFSNARTTIQSLLSGGVYDNTLTAKNGNVGIGTTSPDAKLAVKGTVHSTSILVDLLVPAPDYVFKDDYNLPSLAEIKTYTDKNHHLPGVPAAAEIEKNGINLAEMNMTLLKKVEELTLYLIEQNKQLQKQQKEIEQLKNRQ
jgi:hypothetical protein